MSDLLSEIEERLSNATPGPWDWVPSAVEGGSHVLGVVGESGFPVLRTSPYAPPRQRDADLIAHAPADLAALVAVVREVAALHTRDTWSDCGRCHVAWPCPTAAAVQKLEEAADGR
jgi:hypothetical protein